MHSDETYDSYLDWKKWNRGCIEKAWQSRYFKKEIKRAELSSFKSVLEIGFGNGEFLAWARKCGANVVGIEVIDDLVERSRAEGFETYLWNAAKSNGVHNPLKGQKFDCVVGFDVIEHLRIEELLSVLSHFEELLNPGGKIIFRFPNGESPFSALIFNNDHTHRTLFTRRKLQYICINTSFEVASYRNSARVMQQSWLVWLKWLCFRARDLCELVLGYIYYSKRIPLDQCATVVLRFRQ